MKSRKTLTTEKIVGVVQPRLVRQSSPRIFSGDASEDLWAKINGAKTVKDLRMALYTVCSRMQELESKVESLSLPNARAVTPGANETPLK